MSIGKKWSLVFGVIALLGACRREPDPKSGGVRLSYGLELDADAPKSAREQAQAVIKRRLAALDVAAEVNIFGESIHVDLGGMTAEKAESVRKELALGKLEIREIDDGPAPDSLPKGTLETTATMVDGRQKQVRIRPGGIGPGHVEDASVLKDDLGYSVDVRLNGPGANLLEKMSRDSINRPLAIVLDGKVISMPIVKTPLTDGRARVTMGSGDLEKQRIEAEALVRALKSGALPGRLVLESINVIPPFR